jgi:hypothetical protein
MMPGYLRARAEHKHPLSLPVATDAEWLCCKCPHPTTAERQPMPTAAIQPRRIPAGQKAICAASHCPWAFPDADLCAAETAGPIRPVRRHPAPAGREAQVRRDTGHRRPCRHHIAMQQLRRIGVGSGSRAVVAVSGSNFRLLGLSGHGGQSPRLRLSGAFRR